MIVPDGYPFLGELWARLAHEYDDWWGEHLWIAAAESRCRKGS